MRKNKKYYRKDGLVSKVLKISPKLVLEDEFGKYIPFCSFEHHRGIIKDVYVCEKRDCNHYQKYRLQLNKPNTWHNQMRECAKQYYNKFF